MDTIFGTFSSGIYCPGVLFILMIIRQTYSIHNQIIELLILFLCKCPFDYYTGNELTEFDHFVMFRLDHHYFINGVNNWWRQLDFILSYN